MHFALKTVAAAGIALTMATAFAQKGETVKIALIDPVTQRGQQGQRQADGEAGFAGLAVRLDAAAESAGYRPCLRCRPR